MRGPVMSTLTPQTSRPGGRGARGPQPADGGAQPAEALCHPPVHQQLRPGTEAQRHPDLGGGWAPGRPRPAGRRGEPGPCPCQAWPAGESRTGPASRGPVFPLLSERTPLPRRNHSPDSGFAISSPSTMCLSPPLGPSQTRKISPWRAEVGSQGLAEDGACSWHPICAL